MCPIPGILTRLTPKRTDRKCDDRHRPLPLPANVARTPSPSARVRVRVRVRPTGTRVAIHVRPDNRDKTIRR